MELSWWSGKAHYAAAILARCVSPITPAGERRPGYPSPGVAQACRQPVDGEVDPALHALLGPAGAVTLQELELQVVQRVEVGEAIADRAREARVGCEKRLLARDLEERCHRRIEFAADPAEDRIGEPPVGKELLVP